MPFTLAQLLAADRTIPELPRELVNRTWRQVEHALAREARWQPLRALWQRPKLLLVPAFVAGTAVGAALFWFFQSSAHADVIVMQPDPVQAAPVGVHGTSTPGLPPPAVAAVSKSSTSSASRRDFRDAKRDFESAYQTFKQGNYDASLAALAAHERNFPAGAFASEREILRGRIAMLRDASGPARKVNPAPTTEP
jgi:TolA-binding protein